MRIANSRIAAPRIDPLVQHHMTSATITVDRELVQSFRDWQAEQAVLDAQLVDSVAALEAYQSHLDGWQRELARERDELQRLREELDREKVVDGDRHDKNSSSLSRNCTMRARKSRRSRRRSSIEPKNYGNSIGSGPK